MKDFLSYITWGILSFFTVMSILYGVISLILILKGIDDRANHRNYPNIYERDKCNEPSLNIEKYFPSYKLGCWLGEEQK